MKVLLIVDDEAYARQAVVNTIPWVEYGVEVHQASSGKEALEFMQKYTVDILMTDIRMPSMTGLELLEKVNQMGISPAVIMLSSYNEFELVRSAMQLGAEDYLFKPTMMPTDILKMCIRDRKNTFLSTYFSLGIMIPIHALLIPSVLIFKKIGLTDRCV